MAIKMQRLKSRTEWEQARVFIGGSDASAVMGLNPYMSNADLWELKTGRRKQADISDNPLVKYGAEAEKYLRELFALDNPEYTVAYSENTIVTNSLYPWAHASLDGFLVEKATGRGGVLEIKTAMVQSALARQKWNDQIPQNYYIQVLHYMAVTESQFAIVLAQLKMQDAKVTRQYRIERADVEGDIKLLMDAEKDFWRYVENDTRPPLKLDF